MSALFLGTNGFVAALSDDQNIHKFEAMSLGEKLAYK